MIERVKNILMSPKTEWPIIEAENKPHQQVCTTYVLMLALIPAVASFIGYGLIGYSVLGVKIFGISTGIKQSITQYITMVGGVYISAYIIDLLADTFGARKDFNRAFSLVAYAYTPMFVAGIFYILPSLSWLASLAGLYGLYLLYIGLQPMMQAPAEKQTSYFVVSLLVMIVVSIVLGLILGAIFAAIFISSGASLF